MEYNCLLESLVVIDTMHSTVCWIFILFHSICIEWWVFLIFIIVRLFEIELKFVWVTYWYLKTKTNNSLTFSSNFKPCKRDSMFDNGLSLFVGEPPKTDSTIFTPRTPVESRGLQKKKRQEKTFQWNHSTYFIKRNFSKVRYISIKKGALQGFSNHIV